MSIVPDWVFDQQNLKEYYSAEEMREVFIRAKMFEESNRKALNSSHKRYTTLESRYNTTLSMIINAYITGNTERCAMLINKELEKHCKERSRDIIQIKGIV